MADIGGGSLELIGAVDGLVELTRSLPLGAVRLTELLPPRDRTTQQGAGRPAQARSAKQLKRGISAREWAAAAVIGSGGTFTTLGRIVLARRGLPAGDTVHGDTRRRPRRWSDCSTGSPAGHRSSGDRCPASTPSAPTSSWRD